MHTYIPTYIHLYIWVNYNTSLGSLDSQIASMQISEIFKFTQIHPYICITYCKAEIGHHCHRWTLWKPWTARKCLRRNSGRPSLRPARKRRLGERGDAGERDGNVVVLLWFSDSRGFKTTRFKMVRSTNNTVWTWLQQQTWWFYMVQADDGGFSQEHVGLNQQTLESLEFNPHKFRRVIGVQCLAAGCKKMWCS